MISLMLVLSVFISIQQIEALCNGPVTAENSLQTTTTITSSNCKNLTELFIGITPGGTISTGIGSNPVGLAILTTDVEYTFLGDIILNTISKRNSGGFIVKSVSATSPAAISPSNDKLYVITTGNLVVYDTELNNLNSKSITATTYALSYDLAGGQLYIADSALKKVSILNDNLDEIGSFNWSQDGNAYALAVYNDLVFLAGNIGGQILVFQNQAYLSSYSACAGSTIRDLYVYSCGKYLLATCQQTENFELFTIDGTTLTFVGSKLVSGFFPNKIAVNSDGKIVFTRVGGFVSGYTILG